MAALPPLHRLGTCSPCRRGASTGVLLANSNLCPICLSRLNGPPNLEATDAEFENYLQTLPPGQPNFWTYACRNHHMFHKTCITNWANKSRVCPTCKAPLTYPAPAAAAGPSTAPAEAEEAEEDEAETTDEEEEEGEPSDLPPFMGVRPLRERSDDLDF